MIGEAIGQEPGSYTRQLPCDLHHLDLSVQCTFIDGGLHEASNTITDREPRQSPSHRLAQRSYAFLFVYERVRRRYNTSVSLIPTMTLILEATHYLCKEIKKKEREHQLDGLFTMGPIVICRCLSALHSPSSRWYIPLVVSSQNRLRCVSPGQILLSRQTLMRLLADKSAQSTISYVAQETAQKVTYWWNRSCA